MTMPIAPQHHFTLINGIRTHYVTAGEQHAQTVVPVSYTHLTPS